MENKRPSGHRKNVSGTGKSVYRRGEGLGTGPVTNSRPDNFGSNTQSIHETGRRSSGRNVKRGGGALSLLAIAALLLMVLCVLLVCAAFVAFPDYFTRMAQSLRDASETVSIS